MITAAATGVTAADLLAGAAALEGAEVVAGLSDGLVCEPVADAAGPLEAPAAGAAEVADRAEAAAAELDAGPPGVAVAATEAAETEAPASEAPAAPAAGATAELTGCDSVGLCGTESLG